jgi:hypothetical protein
MNKNAQNRRDVFGLYITVPYFFFNSFPFIPIYFFPWQLPEQLWNYLCFKNGCARMDGKGLLDALIPQNMVCMKSRVQQLESF